MIVFLLIMFFLSMIVLHLKIKGGYSWEDIFSPNRWRAVWVWLVKRYLNWMGESDKYLTTNEMLQVAYRVGKCGDCLQAGKCLHCGCNAEGRLNGDTDECSAGKWGQKLTEEEMNKFRETNELIFNVEISKKNDKV